MNLNSPADVVSIMVREFHHTDWALLSLVFLLGVVVLVGIYTVRSPSDAPTLVGAAVSPSGPDFCTKCSGSPVCAAKDDVVLTYENSCAAACDGAKIIFADVCERIPKQR